MDRSIRRVLCPILGFLACAFLSACASNKHAPNPELSKIGTESTLPPRVSLDLNSDWKFIRKDVPGAEQPGFDDSAWENVTLPHTWNNLDGEDGGNNYYRGPTWYRRHLKLDSSANGKSLFLRVEAASSNATVYINGKPAGPPHKGMFSAFCYDVTQLLNPGDDNVLAIRLTNQQDLTIPPLSADFTFFGGLYRGVKLLELNPVSISPLDDASPGVYVKQVNVSANHADLQVTTQLRNGQQSDQMVDIAYELLDGSGVAVNSTNAEQSLAAAGNSDSVQWLSLDHPHLWNGRKDPYLYYVRVTLSQGNNVIDRVIQPVGLRFFRVDPQQGFILNGQSYPLHGVNRHQDRQDMGWAISSAEQKEDFDLIMDMGCNALRLSHYQHAQEFYDLCDRAGLVVWAEACMVNQVGRSQEFEDTAKQQLRELIKQSFNHPSICFWSLCNELRFHADNAAGRADIEHEEQVVNALNDEAHEIDPTRLTTAATNSPDGTIPLNKITDIIGFNLYYGWYQHTPEYWPSELDKIHGAIPNRAMGVSEYGAGASAFQHELDPRQPKTTARWHPEEWQCTVHEVAYRAMIARPYIWGTFLWAMFDFASDGRAEGDHLGRNDKGLVTYDRKTKKDAFYFYKANWSDDPVIYITDRRFTPRNVSHGPVKVYSNCDSVDLSVNGTSLGTVAGDTHAFVWPDVTLIRGDNQLQATGTRSGKQYSDTITINYDPGVEDVRPVEPATRPAPAPSTMR
jgi:beta-galactosidase